MQRVKRTEAHHKESAVYGQRDPDSLTHRFALLFDEGTRPASREEKKPSHETGSNTISCRAFLGRARARIVQLRCVLMERHKIFQLCLRRH
jgi:hypothetical protein